MGMSMGMCMGMGILGMLSWGVPSPCMHLHLHGLLNVVGYPYLEGRGGGGAYVHVCM